MNCYDCYHDGRHTTAIAICHDCGAGVCGEHATHGEYTLTAVTATNWQAPVEPSQRRIRCHTCAAAITAAADMTIGSAATH
jgi:hypothetical protein